MASSNYPEIYDELPFPEPHKKQDQEVVQNPSIVQPQAGYSAQATVNPSDLLPTDVNSQWSTLNPINQGVTTPDLLQAGYHMGLDSIGQTLKNPNLQLRSDPIIPKKEIGPWNQSTYEPDLMRVPLEVGCQ